MSDLDDALPRSSPMKSSPVVSMTVTAAEREQQLFAQMGKPRLSKAMDKYFLATPSKYEAKILEPTKQLGTEAAMREIANAIKDVTGDRHLVGCNNSGSYIKLRSREEGEDPRRRPSYACGGDRCPRSSLGLCWGKFKVS